MPTSLTPVDISIIIFDETEKVVFDSIDSNISINSFNYTLTLNNIAEAVVGLTYKNKAGLNQLRELFPLSSSRTTYLKKCNVLLWGCNTLLSTIKKDLRLYSGYILGYGQSNKMGFTSFSLNLRGPMARLQQIPMASPGFHTSNAQSYGISPYSTAGTAPSDTQSLAGQIETNASTLINALSSAGKVSKNGFQLFKVITDHYVKILQDVQAIGNLSNLNFTTQSLIDAGRAFGITEGNPNGTIIKNEIATITPSSEIDIDAIAAETIGVVLKEGLIRSFLTSPQLTLWDLFINCLTQFSNNFISLGVNSIISIQNPLLDPSKLKVLNQIKITDMLSYDVGDFPFFTPTRAYVSGNRYVTSLKDADAIYGTYPARLTEQEMATGVYTVIYEYPPIFREMKESNNQTDKKDVTKVGKDAALTRSEEDKKLANSKDSDTKVHWNNYAGYLLMQDKCKQRTAIVSTRFLPTIFPGLPIHIEDPLGIAPFDGQVMSVSHSLDYSGSTALTQININHVRYANEIVTFPNPLFPSFDLSKVENEIIGLIDI